MVSRIMKEIENTEKIMSSLRAFLTELDPAYPQEEQTFRQGLQKFRATLNEEGLALLDRVLEAEESQIAANVIFLFWNGLQQNISCFRDPVAKQFLNLDYEDIHQETIMNGIFSSLKPGDPSRQLSRILDDAQKELNPIPAYYSYIKTVVYKLAHYYGFRFGDSFLPWVVPGYHSDGTSIRYALHLMRDLEIKL